MKFVNNILFLLPVLCLFSCAASNKNYSPSKKYSQHQLQEDYALLRNILEQKHPSLYWYTCKDSMDMYFEKYYADIKDSMTEQQFGWKIIAPLTDKIHCGHTSFGMSKAYNNWAADKRFSSFPLLMKFWNDTMVVTANLNKRDSVLRRGAFITSVNGMNSEVLKNTMFGYMTEDGDANNVNYIRLSSNFPYYHRNIFGLSKNYTVQYIDSLGKEQTTILPLFEQRKDSTKKMKPVEPVKKDKRETRNKQLQDMRSLAIDTVNNTAIITLNTFSSGRLRKFYRQTFRYIRKAGVTNVVLDLRSNGGGRINLSTLLTKYVSRRNFKVADTSFAVARSLRPYTRYVKNGFVNNLGLFFLTKRNKDGLYHFGHWERKVYKPKTKNNFSGNLYVLINGSTFSASTIFCNAVKGQPGVVLAGEEAGGGWYGNNGILIPDIILPNTHLRVRLPLFRLVQYNHVAKNGRGVVPDLYIGTDYNALMKSIDKKMVVVMQMIKESNRRK
ncbi:MAG: hypothetical protein IPP96_00880 [Chitinophagaceae bacterium]|nr:hypothetical protein [Chitinophagaceae bacterium]